MRKSTLIKNVKDFLTYKVQKEMDQPSQDSNETVKDFLLIYSLKDLTQPIVRFEMDEFENV